MLIRNLDTIDLRFPTSRTNAGTDAMHPDPDYSAAYVILETDGGLEGHGFTFTIGRGNEICAEAIRAFRPLVVGRTLESITSDHAAFWRSLASESQLRWLGPEKGVIHLAMAAIVNAVWDLHAKRERKPVWKLLADMSPREIVRCIDFRYITDALTPDEAIELLERQAGTRAQREAEVYQNGLSRLHDVGRLDGIFRRLRAAPLSRGARRRVDALQGQGRQRAGGGCQAPRVGTGGNRPVQQTDDRCQSTMGCQRGDRVRSSALAFQPVVDRGADEPGRCAGARDDCTAVRPVGVATGEHCANRILFKQLLQAEAIDFCQIDSCRLGGVNENLAVMLMAAKFGVPVCPHAGGVGLCELVQHLSLFDYIAISGRMDDRVTEFVDHLHEHFVDPVVVRRGRYMAPTQPGYSITIRPETRATYRYPDGPMWTSVEREPPGMTFPRIASFKTPAALRDHLRALRPLARSRRRGGARADIAPGAAARDGGRQGRQPLRHPAHGRLGRDGRGRALGSDAAALAAFRHQRREVDLGRRSRRGPAGRSGESESAAAHAGDSGEHRAPSRRARQRAS